MILITIKKQTNVLLIQDRKSLIKSFKSFAVKIANEEQGYPVLWTIFDIVDDTKLVSKIILQV